MRNECDDSQSIAEEKGWRIFALLIRSVFLQNDNLW